MRTRSTLTFSKLDAETSEILDRMFKKEVTMIEINPGRVVLPTDFKTIGQEILDMEVNESDVWMCSYPRTGKLFEIDTYI